MLSFIAGIVFGYLKFGKEIVGIGTGLIGLFVSFFILKILDKKMFKDKESKLIIKRILD